jgi:NAD(P)-dependent dehydrogenase (short-subunit alcohol dehydrogenase family)
MESEASVMSRSGAGTAAWTAADVGDQQGRTAVITGGNSGIGCEAARVLAARGATVVLACRDQAKAGQAASQIAAEVAVAAGATGGADAAGVAAGVGATGKADAAGVAAGVGATGGVAAAGAADGAGARVETVRLDLASLASVREAAEELRERYPRLDLLINNAGVMMPPYGRTEDGFELQIGTNHLGHFALTGLVLDRLLAVGGSRVVTVSSNGHRMGRINFDDLNFDHGLTGSRSWPT